MIANLGKIARVGYKTFKRLTPPTVNANAPPTRRPIAHDDQWSLTEYLCSAGPHDRTFEERHERVSIALVTSGTFRYRTDTGEQLLYPGAFLLGNAGSSYECGHEHSHGDRCLALHIDCELFEEIAAGASGSTRYRFRTASLPAVPDLAPISASLDKASLSLPALALQETILTAIETVARGAAANATRPRRPRAAATRRMAAAIDYIESHLATNLSLTELSAYVAMSKYHFLRTFRETSGITPHQYILGRRVRRAAAALRATSAPVARVALDQGFGDLSTFNHYFRRVMGVTPTTYRSSS